LSVAIAPSLALKCSFNLLVEPTPHPEKRLPLARQRLLGERLQLAGPLLCRGLRLQPRSPALEARRQTRTFGELENRHRAFAARRIDRLARDDGAALIQGLEHHSGLFGALVRQRQDGHPEQVRNRLDGGLPAGRKPHPHRRKSRRHAP
jgi:hypothetical protein